MTDSKTNTLEEGRARIAYEHANEINKGLSDDYATRVKNLPALIKNSGLGAALAFVYSKNGNSYDQLYQDVNEYLRSKRCEYIFHDLDRSPGEGEDLMGLITSLNSAAYRSATREVLAYLNWLRRFAEATKQDQ